MARQVPICCKTCSAGRAWSASGPFINSEPCLTEGPRRGADHQIKANGTMLTECPPSHLQRRPINSLICCRVSSWLSKSGQGALQTPFRGFTRQASHPWRSIRSQQPINTAGLLSQVLIAQCFWHHSCIDQIACLVLVSPLCMCGPALPCPAMTCPSLP